MTSSAQLPPYTPERRMLIDGELHRGHHFMAGEIAAGESRVFLTTRTALASVTAFLIAIALGPLAIGWLKARFRERIASFLRRDPGAIFRFGSLATFADGSPPFAGEDVGEVDGDGRIAVIYAFAGRLPKV